MQTTDEQKLIEKFEHTALAFASGQGLFAPNTRVIAACSGGADSMALLLFLLRTRQKLGIQLEVCHVNHGLRGAAADRDEAFVADFCRQNGLVLHRFAPPAPPPENAGEGWARQLRYGFFESLLAKAPAAVIATAHTLTDQAETLLLRAARGTGLHGLAGIPASRPGYCRPFLCLTRADTEGYCRACGQPWVTDETNLTDDYARNRVRHHALPVLRQINPKAEQALGRLAQQSRRLDAYLARRAESLLQSAAMPPQKDCWQLPVLQKADPVELERAMHMLAARFRDPEQKYIELLAQLVRRGSGAVQLTDKALFRAQGGRLYMQTGGEAPLQTAAPQPLRPGIYELPGGYRLKIQLESPENLKKTANIHKKDLNCLADYDRILSSTLLRTRLPGDFFCSAQRGQTKSLKKLYNELGLSAAERRTLPLLAAESRVLWLWGQGFAAGLEPTEETKQILCITEYHNKGE